MLLRLKLGIPLGSHIKRSLDFLIIVNYLRYFKTYTFPGPSWDYWIQIW